MTGHHRALVVDVPAGGEAEEHQDRVLPEHAEHEDLGMGEVDQAENAVDQGVADRDQGVDRAVGQPVDGQLPEEIAQRLDIEIDRWRRVAAGSRRDPSSCSFMPSVCCSPGAADVRTRTGGGRRPLRTPAAEPNGDGATEPCRSRSARRPVHRWRPTCSYGPDRDRRSS